MFWTGLTPDPDRIPLICQTSWHHLWMHPTAKILCPCACF